MAGGGEGRGDGVKKAQALVFAQGTETGASFLGLNCVPSKPQDLSVPPRWETTLCVVIQVQCGPAAAPVRSDWCLQEGTWAHEQGERPQKHTQESEATLTTGQPVLPVG